MNKKVIFGIMGQQNFNIPNSTFQAKKTLPPILLSFFFSLLLLKGDSNVRGWLLFTQTRKKIPVLYFGCSLEIPVSAQFTPSFSLCT